MHGILHATLLVAICLYAQADTGDYVFHPQPWVLTRRTLEDANLSSEDKSTDGSTVSSHQSRSQGNEGYLVYSTGASDEERNSNGDSSEGPRFRSQENPSQDSQDSYQENYEIEQGQRNRYRDEPIDRMDVEDDDDYEYEFRNQHQQQPNQDYSDHSPYPYEGDRGDDQGYDDDEGSYDETNNDNDNSYDNGLQLETNAEPYDDEVAAKDENNNNINPDDTYSLEYPQSDTDSSSSSSSSSSKTDTNSESSKKDGSEKKSSEKQAKGDDGSSEEADYNDDYAYDDDDYDDYQDDTGYAKHRGKKRRRGGNEEDKKVKAPFWAPNDHMLGSHGGGQAWAVQGPPVYFEEGKPQWPPEPHGGGGKGRGRKGGKGGKGGKGKGKKGKKGKKGGRGAQKKGWHKGWGGWEKIGNGGWGEWPKGWMSGNFLDTGGQKWEDGKGWTGGTGAPWIPKKVFPHHWGFPLGWDKMMEERGRGGKKGGKGKKGGGKGKGKKKKKKCKKKKNKRKGRGKGKKGKKRGGCGGKTGWGWPKPHYMKLKPLPPRGSQVWLKPGGGWPQKPIGGWHPQRGWDILRKFTGGGGWLMPDLVGVVHLNG